MTIRQLIRAKLLEAQANQDRDKFIALTLSSVSRDMLGGRYECEWDINTGICEEWAEEALGRLEPLKQELGIKDMWTDWIEDMYPDELGEESHKVLYIDGRFYDSQHPHGVESVHDLDVVKGVRRSDWLSGRAKLLEGQKEKGPINEMADSMLTLYHGTCGPNAKALMSNGWSPRQHGVGGNMGQSRYLYLTNDSMNALWFAEESGCNQVLKVQVPRASLRVDPEDGTYDTVEEELSGSIPGSVVCYMPLPADAFTLVEDPVVG